ncbi:MAG: hypothetical protein ACKO0M_09900 [Cyanobium sp.]
MERGEPDSGRDLPAPYRNPWRALAESLAAVSADMRLGLRRLWRRNLEGELPLPGFWPIALAGLFWPLASLLLIGVVALSLILLQPSSAGGGVPGANPSAGPSDSPASMPPREAPLPARPRAVPGPASEAPDQGPPGSGFPLARAVPERLTASLPAEPSALRLDPLFALVSDGEDGALLLAARPDPEHRLLLLTLTRAAVALPDRALQPHAERWQQRAGSAGYDRLELRDSRGRLRGRTALVGSGMILLSPAPDT